MRIKQTGKALSAFLSGQNAPVSAALHGWTHPAVQIRLEATFEEAIKGNAATQVLIQTYYASYGKKRRKTGRPNLEVTRRGNAR